MPDDMKATVYHGARDVRLETVPDPSIVDPGDAIVRVTRAAICGSDLWFYRGVTQWTPGDRTGHEFVGMVEEAGPGVKTLKAGDLVIAPFVSSDGTCEFCHMGLQTSCEHMSNFGDFENGGQAQYVRVPFADGTLVKMPEAVAQDGSLHAGAVTLTDVMGTGHHGIVAANTRAGGTVVVVGDGAVGLCAVLSAAKLEQAQTIVAVGHNNHRLEIAKKFGATHTLNSHEPVVDAIKEITHGGSVSVVEAVGNQASMEIAIDVARPGGTISFVGVPHNVKEALPLRTLFLKNVSLRGALAPVRAYLPRLAQALANKTIDPSPVLDLQLPLEDVAKGYDAMDKRKAIKVLLAVS